MTRPEWVEAGARALDAEHVHYPGMANDALAWVVVNAVEPLIRADEQKQYGRQSAWVTAGYRQGIIHAETVAARLVEVICEDDVDRQDSYSVQVWQAEVIRERVEHDLRAQIAVEIEAAARDPFESLAGKGAMFRAARIARGES